MAENRLSVMPPAGQHEAAGQAEQAGGRDRPEDRRHPVDHRALKDLPDRFGETGLHLRLKEGLKIPAKGVGQP